MGKTEVTCACGAIYERTEHKVAFRDQDSFECSVCDKTIEEWSSSRYPTFKLIKKP